MRLTYVILCEPHLLWLRWFAILSNTQKCPWSWKHIKIGSYTFYFKFETRPWLRNSHIICTFAPQWKNNFIIVVLFWYCFLKNVLINVKVLKSCLHVFLNPTPWYFCSFDYFLSKVENLLEVLKFKYQPPSKFWLSTKTRIYDLNYFEVGFFFIILEFIMYLTASSQNFVENL